MMNSLTDLELKKRERARCASQKYNETHRKERRALSREWHRRNPGDAKKKAAYLKKYRERPEVKTRCANVRRIWVQNYRQTNKGFSVLCRLRTRLQHVLDGASKDIATLNLVGCSITELLIHLESTFQPGMSWENRNLWHIDHIRPCASFDLTDPKQQKQCFHYSNLQALWAIDNIRKGAKLPELIPSTTNV